MSLNSLLRRGWFPGLVQGLLLAVVLLSAWFAWLPGLALEPGAVKSLLFTNVSLFLVWVVFKPGLFILLAACLGAVWCMACPGRALMDAGHRVGLGLPYPVLLQNLALLLLFFFLHRVAAIYFNLHSNPWGTAILLLVLLGLPAAYGLSFGDKVFCRLVCPMRRLIGLFSLCAPVDYGVQDERACSECAEKPCSRDGAGSRVCPVGLDPVRLHISRACLLCLECLKRCPKDNIGFRLRPPLSGFRDDILWDRAEPLFLAMMLGITLEAALQGTGAEGILRPGQRLGQWAGGFPGALLAGAWTYLFLPGALLAVPGAIQRLSGRAASVGGAAASYARCFVPLVFSGLLLVAFAKANRFLAYGDRLWQDPQGLAAAAAIASGAQPGPAPLLPPPVFMAAAVLLVFGALAASFWVMMRTARAARWDAVSTGSVLLALLVTALAYCWRFAEKLL